jgi:Fe-S-cluster containining protein
MVVVVPEHQVCRQCGTCCERWGWGQKGIVEDLLPWLEQNRRDILQHVAIRLSDGRRISGTALSREDLPRIARISYWQDPSGRMMRKCPFFRRDAEGLALCGIHELKPRVCREFAPWTWQNNEFYGSCPACREKAP